MRRVRWRYSLWRSDEIIAVVGPIVAIVALFAGIWMWIAPYVWRVNVRFDRQAWLSDRSMMRTSRGPMLDDLNARILRPGTPRGDVDRLLGKPDSVWKGPQIAELVGTGTGEVVGYHFNVGYPSIASEDTNFYILFNNREELTRVLIYEN